MSLTSQALAKWRVGSNGYLEARTEWNIDGFYLCFYTSKVSSDKKKRRGI
jgi:hypothetical protein